MMFRHQTASVSFVLCLAMLSVCVPHSTKISLVRFCSDWFLVLLKSLSECDETHEFWLLSNWNSAPHLKSQIKFCIIWRSLRLWHTSSPADLLLQSLFIGLILLWINLPTCCVLVVCCTAVQHTTRKHSPQNRHLLHQGHHMLYM